MLQKIGSVRLVGDVHRPEDISAIASFGPGGDEFLAIGSDESRDRIQILQKRSISEYRVIRDISLTRSSQKSTEELDIESIAIDGDTLYAIGSHSLRRKAVRLTNTCKQNRKRLFQVVKEDRKNQVFTVPIDLESGEPNGKIKSRDRLQSVLKKDDILGPFTKIPSKENGVDIEGVAVQDGKLFLGFRGPVLRGNYVPVMVTSLKKPKDYELRFINLDGRGIRDILSVVEGFLLIAGPMGDGLDPYELFFWDGSDLVPGTDRPISPQQLYSFGQLTPPLGAKAEGITLLKSCLEGTNSRSPTTAFQPDKWRFGMPSELSRDSWIILTRSRSYFICYKTDRRVC